MQLLTHVRQVLFARVDIFVCEGASISTLCSPADPVVDSCFSCDPVVTVFYPILVFVGPELFWLLLLFHELKCA